MRGMLTRIELVSFRAFVCLARAAAVWDRAAVLFGAEQGEARRRVSVYRLPEGRCVDAAVR